MKVTIQGSDRKEEKRQYPYFGVFKDEERFQVVYFIGRDTGVCICDYNGFDNAGRFEDYWAEYAFTPITAPILIEP